MLLSKVALEVGCSVLGSDSNWEEREWRGSKPARFGIPRSILVAGCLVCRSDRCPYLWLVPIRTSVVCYTVVEVLMLFIPGCYREKKKKVIHLALRKWVDREVQERAHSMPSIKLTYLWRSQWAPDWSQSPWSSALQSTHHGILFKLPKFADSRGVLWGLNICPCGVPWRHKSLGKG